MDNNNGSILASLSDYREPIREKNLCFLSLLQGIKQLEEDTCKCMNRTLFDELRNLPNKVVNGEIRFALQRNTSPLLTFEPILVENELGVELFLNGRYHPVIGTVVYNFVVKKVGAICRVCVNGNIHGDCGRTHKHELRRERDPLRNLPTAIEREDLVDMSAREVWEDLCSKANITHNGLFIDPS